MLPLDFTLTALALPRVRSARRVIRALSAVLALRPVSKFVFLTVIFVASALQAARADASWRPVDPVTPPPSARWRDLIGNLRHVAAFPDGRVLVAVGSHGTIRRSDDGGLAWSTVMIDSEADLTGIAVLKDGWRAVIVGTGGTILISSDAGATWQRADSTTDQDFFSVTALPDGKTVLAAAGTDGTMLRSSDGGAHWATVASSGQPDTNATAMSIAISPDGQRLLAADGNLGQLRRSDDGGLTWKRQSAVDEVALFRIIALPDGKTVVAGGFRRVMIHRRNANGTIDDVFSSIRSSIVISNDAGTTWHTTGPSVSGSTITGFVMLANGTTLFALHGDAGLLFRSDDAGTTWHSTTTYPALVTMNDMVIVPMSHRLIGVGDQGMIIRGENDGQTWGPPVIGKSNSLFAVTATQDNKSFFAVGGDAGATVIQSDNLGASWRATLNEDGGRLFCVTALPDGHTVLAGGEAGMIQRSDDRGAHWTADSLPSDGDVYGILSLPERGSVIAVGARGSIFMSNDAGRTWTARDSSGSERLSAVAASGDGETIYVVGDNATVLRSRDAGATWQHVSIPAPAISNTMFHAVAMSRDAKTVVAVGEWGSILLSADAGETWNFSAVRGTSDYSAILGVNHELEAVAVLPDGKSIIVGAQDGEVYRSDDGGDTWLSATGAGELINTALNEQHLTGLTVSPDGEKIVAVGLRNLILQSTNAGRTWNLRRRLPATGLRGVAVRDGGQTLVAVGTTGVILRSSDGGMTWDQIPSGISALLVGIVALPSRRLLIAGRDGSILISDNAGLTWRRSRPGTSISAIGASMNGEILVASDGSTMLVSSDDGENWTRRAFPGNDTVNSIAVFSDNRTVIAVGDKGLIVRSGDRAETWNQPLQAGTNHLRAVVALPDGHTALAGGEAGLLYRSEDAGGTWTFVSAPVTNDNDVRGTIDQLAVLPESRLLVAVESPNAVLLSEDLGKTWGMQRIGNTSPHGITASPDGKYFVAVGDNSSVVALIPDLHNRPPVANEVRMRDDVAVEQGRPGIEVEWRYPVGADVTCNPPEYGLESESVPLRTISGSVEPGRDADRLTFAKIWDPDRQVAPGQRIHYSVNCTDKITGVSWIQHLPGLQTWQLKPPILTELVGWFRSLRLRDQTLVVAAVVLASWLIFVLALFAFSPATLVKIEERVQRLLPPLSLLDPSENEEKRWLTLIISIFRLIRFLTIGFLANRLRAIDAWLAIGLPAARTRFEGLPIVEARRIAVELPITLTAGGKIRELQQPWPEVESLLRQSAIVILVSGPGGSGKTTLACHIGRRLLGGDGRPPLAGHLAIPILIDGELREDARSPGGLCGYIAGMLGNMLGHSETVSASLTQRLLRARRLVVLVDGLSERSNETRQALDPNRHGFPISCMVATSRDAMLPGVTAIIEPKAIPAGALYDFIHRYVVAWADLATEPAPDEARIHSACAELTRIMRGRPVTPLLAELWALELRAEPRADAAVASGVADLMDKYVRRLLQTSPPDEDRLDHLRKDLTAIAVRELAFNLQAGFITRGVALEVLRAASGGQPSERLRVLLDSRLLEAQSDNSDQVRIAPDPLAEHLVARHEVESHGANLGAWQSTIMTMKDKPGIEGFLSALMACCENAGYGKIVPPSILADLAALLKSRDEPGAPGVAE